jgi:hypothetical protein
MDDIITIEVSGLAETAAMLENAPDDIVATGFFKALQAGGDVIAEVLASNTPEKKEDTGGVLEQGELLESIRMKIELDSQLRGGRAIVGFTTNNMADRVALFVDSGHRIVIPGTGFYTDNRGRQRRGTVVGSVVGNGFVRNSFDQSAEAAIAAFAASLEQTVKEMYPQAGAA